VIVTDDHTFSRVFTAHDVARNRFSHPARIRKGKIFGNNAAPAIGAKLYCRHFRLSIREARKEETAGLARQNWQLRW
jgi:hypothetical protein